MFAATTESRKTSVLLILAVLAIVAGLAMIYIQATNLSQLQSAVEDEKLALARSETLLAQLREFEANAPLYREKTARLAQMIPEQPQEEEILRLINLAASEFDLRVHEVRFETRVDDAESGFVQMPLAITIEGNYRGLIDILDHLQWSGRTFRVDQVRIALAGADQGGIRTVISASAFHRLDIQPIANE